MLLESDKCKNPHEGTTFHCWDGVQLAKQTLHMTELAALDNRDALL